MQLSAVSNRRSVAFGYSLLFMKIWSLSAGRRQPIMQNNSTTPFYDSSSTFDLADVSPARIRWGWAVILRHGIMSGSCVADDQLENPDALLACLDELSAMTVQIGQKNAWIIGR